MPLGFSAHVARDLLLAGPAVTDQPLLTWPLSRAYPGSDEHLLAAFCSYLGLDEKGYQGLVHEMVDLTPDP